MIKTNRAVIVEGKYDKIKLSSILDALIIETNGFGIYKDAKRRNFIKKLAAEKGLIIITDSDSSGFQIRNYIASFVPKEQIIHIYTPDIFGKEKRKSAPSAQGKLGVEGIDSKILIKLFEKYGVDSEIQDKRRLVTNYDLFEDGFSGTANSKSMRRKLLKILDLPEFLSTNSFIDVVNATMSYEEYKDACEKIRNSD